MSGIEKDPKTFGKWATIVASFSFIKCDTRDRDRGGFMREKSLLKEDTVSIFRFFKNWNRQVIRSTQPSGNVGQMRRVRLCRLELMEKRNLLAIDAFSSGLDAPSVDAEGNAIAALTAVEDTSVYSRSTALLSSATLAVGSASSKSIYQAPDTIQVGGVFSEDNYKEEVEGSQTNDSQPDTFVFGFTGGATGTELTTITLDGDSDEWGLIFDIEDVVYDGTDTRGGKYGGVSFKFDAARSSDGVSVTNVVFSDDCKQVTLTVSGLTADKVLAFTVDVDRYRGDKFGAGVNPSIDVEGVLTFETTFTHDQYEDLKLTGNFKDEYIVPDDLTNQIPDDAFTTPPGWAETEIQDKTAGAFAEGQQIAIPGSISGKVFYESTGGSCDYDSTTDKPASGVTVELWVVDGNVIATTTTAADGSYIFTQLDPFELYSVKITKSNDTFAGGTTVYNGAAVGTGGGTVESNRLVSDISVDSKTESSGYDFCLVEPGAVSGTVWVDLDKDCEIDDTEERLSGVTITLKGSDGTIITTTLTSDNGKYAFENLDPRLVYTIMETQPEGYFDGCAQPGNPAGEVSENTISNVKPPVGGEGINYNFGELSPAEISGRVFYESTGGDCDYGSTTDKPASGVTVDLLDADGNVVATTTTASDGTYSFTGLEPLASYGVRITKSRDDVFYNGSKVGTGGGTVESATLVDNIVPLVGSSNENYDFCLVEPGAVSGTVWVDTNLDCVIDPDELLLSGVTITLVNSDGEIIATIKTDSEGFYEFTGLDPRDVYTIKETQPEGYYNSPEECGADEHTNVKPPVGGTGTGYNFAELAYSQISGYVWEDDNNNGVWDDGEAAISGAVIYLLDATGVRTGDMVTTNSDGYYEFIQLIPAVYGLEELLPDGYYDGKFVTGAITDSNGNPTKNYTGDTSVDGTTDFIKGIELTIGTKGTNFNFGELRPSSIEGLVYYDENYNGSYDEGEELLKDVVVKLVGEDGTVVSTATTDDNGVFIFTNLRPFVTYTMIETQPDDYLDARDEIVGDNNAGGTTPKMIWSIYVDDDTMTGITPGAGQAYDGYHFGEVKPASLSGKVFQDGDTIEYTKSEGKPAVQDVTSGVYKDGDKLLAGVTITLGDASGNPITDASGNKITTTTDKNGYYIFKNVFPGTYTVMEAQPDSYDDGLDTAGTNEGTAFNQGVKLTEAQAKIAANENVPRYDTIAEVAVAPGDDATDYDFSEVVMKEVDDPEPPYVPSGNPPQYGPYMVGNSPWLAGVVGGTGSNYSPTNTSLNNRLGGGLTLPYSWHLVVLNGGSPRQRGQSYSTFITDRGGILMESASGVTPEIWGSQNLSGATWMLFDGVGNTVRIATYGLSGGVPITGDWNGDGKEEIGVYYGGYFWLDLNGDGLFDGESDLWVQLGDGMDKPVAGDWDGDGRTDVGIYGPEWGGDKNVLRRRPGLPDLDNHRDDPMIVDPFKNLPPWLVNATDRVKTFRNADGMLRQDLIDHVFRFGTDADYPVTGDWNNDGITNIGLFRDGHWSLDMDGDGRYTEADAGFDFGDQGDLPVTGDWSGDGHVQYGLFRNGTFILDTNDNHQIDNGDRQITMTDYREGDLPVAFDHNGDGISEVGLYRPAENLWQKAEQEVSMDRSTDNMTDAVDATLPGQHNPDVTLPSINSSVPDLPTEE